MKPLRVGRLWKPVANTVVFMLYGAAGFYRSGLATTASCFLINLL
jgi:hypothetical protein